MSTKPLTERDIDVLGCLEAATRNLTECPVHGPGWCRPMDCGGFDGSYHAYVLAKLAKRGLADVRCYGYIRFTRLYKINDNGRATLSKLKPNWRFAR